ncbi:SusF/SusE family outer membrane protein [Flavivirga sp. 57AJ16]|uniref:SusF/SusE family outer membrane protein n=1 Tax=Flavivirga sp. 57AJ16 TaxID=3025307 RepID=UPI0023665F2C|nr:SusF/SusE family outer membrane protein [Flavivirga sp. 57AJ16]MDD7885388.1 SusF/SusE family outer membrane protein [Flavivirga sp. 57AJ16]
MKNINKLISFILMSIVISSCEDNGLENIGWLTDPVFENPMTLTPSSEDVVMTAGNDDAEAITFAWTPGNERGAETTLQYIFRMDIVGNNFSEETALQEEIPTGVLTKTYTVGELNSLLLKKFGRAGNVVTNLEVQIIARVDNSAQFQKPEIATAGFSATSFSPGPLPLFMVGDAISGSWDYSLGISFPEITERTIYNFVGDFSVGSFKVIESPGNELPSYDPAAGNTIVYNETDPRTDDNVFKVEEVGRHSLYMDIDEGTYVFGYVPYENVYMVGQAISGIGWDIGNAKQMNWDPKNPEEFTFAGQFDAGEFKLYTQQGDWNGRALMPPVNGTILVPDAEPIEMSLMPNAQPDNKWVIEETGQYELIVNPANMTIMLKKI